MYPLRKPMARQMSERQHHREPEVEARCARRTSRQNMPGRARPSRPTTGRTRRRSSAGATASALSPYSADVSTIGRRCRATTARRCAPGWRTTATRRWRRRARRTRAGSAACFHSERAGQPLVATGGLAGGAVDRSSAVMVLPTALDRWAPAGPSRSCQRPPRRVPGRCRQRVPSAGEVEDLLRRCRRSTKPGPVSTGWPPPTVLRLLWYSVRNDDRQVALQVLLLVDGEQHVAVDDRLDHVLAEVERADDDLAGLADLVDRRRAPARHRSGRARARRRWCRRPAASALMVLCAPAASLRSTCTTSSVPPAASIDDLAPAQRASSPALPTSWLMHITCVAPASARCWPAAWPAIVSSWPTWVIAPIVLVVRRNPELTVMIGMPASWAAASESLSAS